jgi:hypothetical protein
VARASALDAAYAVTKGEAAMTDVTNPGSTNAADEGFGVGPIRPNQPVTTGPSTNPGPLDQSGDFKPGQGDASPDQPVTVGPSSNAGGIVQAGTASPTSPDCENITTNNVVGQVYGTGTPANVYV